MGIYANKKLFRAYTFLWVGVLVTGVPILVLDELLYVHINESEMKAKFDIAYCVCLMIQSFIN